MTSDIDEALDWQGREIDCGSCAHAELRAASRCRLKHACVQDRYARRIDRFFNWNPDLANNYVGHPHFEVRAIAAKHASVFLLPPLLDDAEETVRWNAARRLPKRLIMRLRRDPHREVRIRIVSMIDDADLIPMMSDSDYYVRLVIARKIDPRLLGPLIEDVEPEVRRVVAQRVPRDWLLGMATDTAAGVRIEIAKRLAPDLLSRLRSDADWRVRYEVASRIALRELGPLADDEDELVRDMARGRLSGLAERSMERPR